MTKREQLAEDLVSLDEVQIGEVADFVAFIALRSRVATIVPADQDSLRALFSRFEAEDISLAESGMGDYRENLKTEDRSDASSR